MRAFDAISEMRTESGTSMERLSAEIGRSKTYVGTMLQTQKDSNMSTFCAMAKAMGYEVVVRKGDTEIKLD